MKKPSLDVPLLYCFWARGRDEPIWIERAVEELNLAIEQASQWTEFHGLHGGLCGLGWVTQCVARLVAGGVDSYSRALAESKGSDDPLGEIDEFMLKVLDCSKWRNAYDLSGGLVGYGVYFLERLPREMAVHALMLVLKHLKALSETSSNGISWRSGPEVLSPSMRAQCPDGLYNLGAAHGIAGVIYLLGEMVAAGIEAEECRVLLEGAVGWLIAHQRPRSARSRFSACIAPDYSIDSQPAWCYGDFGIVPVLIRTARHTRRREWVEFAHDLLDHCLAWPVEQSGVMEAGLCHGACGIAHIFNRLSQSEGDHRCRDASLKWLEFALKMRQPEKGVGGFVALTARGTPEDAAADASYDLLHGGSGVALALLAALAPVEPEWDRLMLLSGRNWSAARGNLLGTKTPEAGRAHT